MKKIVVVMSYVGWGRDVSMALLTVRRRCGKICFNKTYRGGVELVELDGYHRRMWRAVTTARTITSASTRSSGKLPSSGNTSFGIAGIICTFVLRHIGLAGRQRWDRCSRFGRTILS